MKSIQDYINEGLIKKKTMQKLPVSEILYKYVDLGLPSGTLWADRNIGAENPEDCGYYVAWGETEPKPYYSMTNYKFTKINKATGDVYYKYNNSDGKLKLDNEDDIAYEMTGGDASIPSLKQITELHDAIKTKKIKSEIIKNYNNTTNTVIKLTAENGNYIILPLVGKMTNSNIIHNDIGQYLTRQLTKDRHNILEVPVFIITNEYTEIVKYSNRNNGRSVRAVKNK